MKLDRYVIRELIVPFLIGTLAVVLMFEANLLIALFKNLSLSGIPFSGILKLLLYKTPFFMNMTLPVGIALATSLAMARFTRESELTAMRAAGASILRVMLPISLFGIAVGVGNFYLAEDLMPRAEKAATKLQNELTLLGGAPDFKANVHVTLGDYSVDIKTLSRRSDGSLQLDDVVLIQRPRTYEVGVYLAKTGLYDKGVWTFKNANAWYFKDDSLYQFQSKEMTIFQRININDIYSQSQPTEMSIGELSAAIQSGKQQKNDTTMLQVTYHTRFSVPAACYVFAIAGPVFAIWLGRGGGFMGVLLSILMVMLWYNVFIISTEIFGRNGWLNPLLAAWMPNILFFVLAVFGLRRLE